MPRIRPSRFAINSYRNRMASMRAMPYGRTPTEGWASDDDYANMPTQQWPGDGEQDDHNAGQDESVVEAPAESVVEAPLTPPTRSREVWMHRPIRVRPPLWETKVVDAIYVSKIKKDPASWFVLHLGGRRYMPATLAVLAFTDDDDSVMDRVTPTTNDMELFPVLRMQVSYPKNAAAHDELMEGEGVVESITKTVGHATKAAMRVLQEEAVYPIFDDDE